MTEAEQWAGSRVMFDSWCPRGTGYFVSARKSPLAMWFGSIPGRGDYDPALLILHPQADPTPVMAAHVAEAFMPAGVGELVGCWS